MKITNVTIPNTNYTKGREGNTVNKIVMHWVVGSLATCDATFKNKDRKASAHYCIEDSTIHQYVQEADTAWHAGNWNVNTQSIGIEHSGGELINGKRRKPSEETHKTSAWLVSEIAKKYNIPLDRKHILKHSEVSDSPTACCGTLDVDYIIKLAKESEPMIIKPSDKLPEPFYKINEAKELKKRKRLTDKDAFDTILANFIKVDDELKEQIEHFEKEREAAVKIAVDKLNQEHTNSNIEREQYTKQLEARIQELEADSKGTLATAKELINKLKNIFGL